MTTRAQNTIDNAAALAEMAGGSPVPVEKETLSGWAARWLSGQATGTASQLGGPSSPYNEYIWSNACIRALSINAARVPIKLSRGEASGTRSVWGHKHVRCGGGRNRRKMADRLAKRASVHKAAEGEIIETGDLHALLERPNSHQTWSPFIRETVTYLYVYGSVHWLFDEMIGCRPVSMYAVPGHRSTAVVDKSGLVERLVGWKFRDPHGGEYPVTLDECITFSIFNPEDKHGGLAPHIPARLAIASDYNASTYNAAMFHNSCEPGTTLETEAPFDKVLDDQIRTSWVQRHGGPLNANKFAILWGGLKHNSVAKTLKEMVYAEGKQLSRVEVCAVYRVPPTVAGFFGTSGDSSAYTDNEMERFWQDTEAPLVGDIAEAIDVHLCPRFEGNLEAWADVEDVPVYQKMRRARIAVADKMFKMGVPMEDIIENLDLALPERPWYAAGFLPLNIQPAHLAAAETPDEPVNEPSDDDDETDELGQNGVKSVRGVPAARKTASNDRLTRIWKAWEASWKPLAGRFESMLRAHYRRQETAILKSLRKELKKSVSSGSSVATKSAVSRILFAIFGDPKSKRAFRDRVRAFLTDAAGLGVRQALSEAGVEGDALDDAAAEVAGSSAITDALKSNAVRVSTLVDGKTRGRLKAALTEGFAGGEDIRQLTTRVQEIMGNSRKAAMVTARNAVGQTLSHSRHVGHKKAGMTHKVWVHSRGPGERRESHVAAEARYATNPIPLDQPFEIGGAKLMYPRDFSAGEPGETVNCQCLQLAKRKKKKGDG